MKKRVFAPVLILLTSFVSGAQADWRDDLSAASKSDVATSVLSSQIVKSSTETAANGIKETAKQMATDSLVGFVSNKAGVTSDQAMGGIGAIFKTAKSALNGDDFNAIAKSVPNMGELLAAAPEKESSGGLVDGLLAGAGKAGELIGVFDMLGLSAGQVSTFTSLIQQYFTSEEKPELSDLLMQGVSSFL